MEINGVINVYKEAGYTSHDVVAKLRGIFYQKKIGHTGTLDPEAEGVLPVCLGKATRLCDMLADHDKVYEAVLHLGIDTDTQDMTGRILEEKPVNVTEEEVRLCVESFVGEQMQVPPMYSALKVNGEKAKRLRERQEKYISMKLKSLRWNCRSFPSEFIVPRELISGHCVMISEKNWAVEDVWKSWCEPEWKDLN